MKALFKDLLEVADVQGVVYVSLKGETIFREFAARAPVRLATADWQGLIRELGTIHEAEVVYENGRLYLRRAPQGLILVVMDTFALTSMVRLNCDILLPALEQSKKKGRGLARFFR